MKFLIIPILLISQFLAAQELPPIRNYTPAEYGAENQNWSLSQSTDRIIFAANNKGLLEFNGARWKLHPSPNETILRSVQVIGDRIYTGCYMEFGYWLRDATGGLQYTSLTKRSGIELVPDEEFWNILEIDGDIVFQSLDRIYIYDPDQERVRPLESVRSSTRIFNLNGALYFHVLNKGIYRLVNGEIQLLSDHPIIQRNEVVLLSDWNESMMILTKEEGFFMLTDAELIPWVTEVSSTLPEANVYSAIRLNDGGFAVGTISSGLLLIDKEGRVLESIDHLGGLGNNTVLSLLEDVDKNLWLGLDNGIDYLDLESPVRIYRDKQGKLGSVYAAATHNDLLYLGTNQGLFYRRSGETGDFKLVNGTRGQVWSLDVFEGTLFCSHHEGTFVVRDGQARKVEGTEGSWRIKEFRDQEGILLQGSYDGLHVLENADGQWRLRNKIAGFEHSSRFLEIFGRTVFVNHEYKGVFRVEVDTGFNRATQIAVDTVMHGADSGIAEFEGNLYYASRPGVFKFDPSRQAFQKDSLLSTILAGEAYSSGKMITEAEMGRLWMFGDAALSYLSRGSLSGNTLIRHIPLTQVDRNDIQGYENLIPYDDQGTYLMGNRSGYLTLDLESWGQKEFRIGLSEVQLIDRFGDGEAYRRLPLDEGLELSVKENNLEFYMHASVYGVFPKPLFQYRLEGLHPDWSDWTEASQVRFENLPPGRYRLSVRGRIGEYLADNTIRYSFSISKPWYLSTGMLVLYAAVTMLLGFLIHLSYRKYYRHRQRKLEERSKREMALAQALNEKEIIRLKNAQLKEQFKSKSNELAAATMSIIKKNELLSKVKHELLATVSDKEALAPIVKIIDKSLSRNDDWEMFKEAFDNVDREFLEKLKAAHPNLTNNDIKLCAFLRLNLTSKEIAPMFNISPRSVEIKRYRLRKKMNLDQDENLVNYILTL